MTAVNHFIRALDSQFWHGIEKVAYTHPNASRLLALPIAFSTVIRDTLATPAKFIEENIRTAISIKAYLAEKDPKMFFWKQNDIEWHSVQTVKYMIITP